MEDYKLFWIFFLNNKLVTAVLCFGSHICNQAVRIRVNMKFNILFVPQGTKYSKFSDFGWSFHTPFSLWPLPHVGEHRRDKHLPSVGIGPRNTGLRSEHLPPAGTGPCNTGVRSKQLRREEPFFKLFILKDEKVGLKYRQIQKSFPSRHFYSAFLKLLQNWTHL